MFTDAANETRPVGRNRRRFLKELGLGGIALTSLLADQPASGAVAYRGQTSASRLLPGSHTSLPGRGTSSCCSWSVAQVRLRRSITSRF